MDKQERRLNETSHLVQAINRLVDTLGASEDGGDSDTDMSPEAITDMSPEAITDAAQGEMATEAVMPTTARALQEVRLGYEIDRCSGTLSVQNRYGYWVTVPRGQWTTIDVAINGDGYWYWRCGRSNERSRGAPNFRQRVKRLRVWHSTEGRKITWWCYDLL